jgi:hypothetical protein
MAEDGTRLKIVIPVEEEAPFVPETTRRDVKAGVLRAGQEVVNQSKDLAASAWHSETRKKATAGMRRGGAKVAAKGSQIVREKILSGAGRQAKQGASAIRGQLKSKAWKRDMRTGSANGLRWLSGRLEGLADRFTPLEDAISLDPVDPREQ